MLMHQCRMHHSLWWSAHTSYYKNPGCSCISTPCLLVSSRVHTLSTTSALNAHMPASHIGVHMLPTMCILDAHTPAHHAPQPVVKPQFPVYVLTTMSVLDACTPVQCVFQPVVECIHSLL